MTTTPAAPSLPRRALSRVAAWLVKQALPSALTTADSRGSWWPLVVRESFPGAWQRNVTLTNQLVESFFAVYSCKALIANDIGKLRLQLMEQRQPSGIWAETSSPAFGPVLRKPNHFQTRQQFVVSWVLSLLGGNAYILKQRDGRGVVTALYVLDPTRVRPLVAPADGAVYYQLGGDDLSQIHAGITAAPASEIIHDRINPLFHPLVGVSPLFACALAATQGLAAQENSAAFFQNMSRPSGILSAPGEIGDTTAARLKTHWEQNYQQGNIGKIAVLGDGLQYHPLAVTPEDSQIVQQLQLSAKQVCSAFLVPAYKVGVDAPPTYNNVEALEQAYYAQCLQHKIESIEALLDEGLGLDGLTDRKLRTEFDLDDLLRMDTATAVKTINEQVKGGWLKINEARAKRNLEPVQGGDSPYLQEQNYSLEALARRDALDDPFGRAPAPAPAPPPAAAAGGDGDEGAGGGDGDDDDDDAADGAKRAAMKALADAVIARFTLGAAGHGAGGDEGHGAGSAAGGAAG